MDNISLVRQRTHFHAIYISCNMAPGTEFSSITSEFILFLSIHKCCKTTFHFEAEGIVRHQLTQELINLNLEVSCFPKFLRIVSLLCKTFPFKPRVFWMLPIRKTESEWKLPRGKFWDEALGNSCVDLREYSDV